MTALLTASEERRLFRRLRRAQQASDVLKERRIRDRVVLANLRLVTKIAEGYRWADLDLGDLVSVGHLGLFVAVRRFEVEAGVRFSTYATPWVHDYIRKHVSRELQYRDRFRADTDLEITVERDTFSPCRIAPDRAEEVTVRFARAELVDTLLASVPERRAEVVRRHYGLAGHTEQTFEAIGQEMGKLSRPWAQQQHARAIYQMQCIAGVEAPPIPAVRRRCAKCGVQFKRVEGVLLCSVCRSEGGSRKKRPRRATA